MIVDRPNWNNDKPTVPLDLSKNVHYDDDLNTECHILLYSIDNINSYPNEFVLYKSISNYYHIPIDNLAIGFGATDIIERTIKSLDYNRLVIVSPTFEMVEVYCQLNAKEYIKINNDQIEAYANQNDALYIANPNGLTGDAIDIKHITSKFKYVIADEVYADFYNEYSLLNDCIDNVIVIKSLSKSLGLAGFRVGFSVASEELTKIIQMYRMNYVSNSISCFVIPYVIGMTKEVIARMNVTKNHLESTFKCKKSVANFVLFESPNKYTKKFGYKLVNGLYRMALTDMKTLDEHN